MRILKQFHNHLFHWSIAQEAMRLLPPIGLVQPTQIAQISTAMTLGGCAGGTGTAVAAGIGLGLVLSGAGFLVRNFFTRKPSHIFIPRAHHMTLQKEKGEFKDKFLRTHADLEKFRKRVSRVSREKEELLKFGNVPLLMEILLIKDELERALSYKDNVDTPSFIEGLEMILNKFNKLMVQFNIEAIETIGMPFDPQKHQAESVKVSRQPPGTILAEYQKGYIHHGRLLRPARVLVAKAADGTPNMER